MLSWNVCVNEWESKSVCRERYLGGWTSSHFSDPLLWRRQPG